MSTNFLIAGSRTHRKLSLVALLAFALAGCGHAPNLTDTPAASSLTINKKTSFVAHSDPMPTARKSIAKSQNDLYGLASYYEDTQTANGERFDPNALTAAHRTLPFGTRVRVTEVSSGRSVTVRVNDRGPFVAGRVIDVSYAAAKTLGMVDKGLAEVKLHVINNAAYASQ